MGRRPCRPTAQRGPYDVIIRRPRSTGSTTRGKRSGAGYPFQVTRRKSRIEQNIRRHFAVADAYRRHSDSPRQRELAARDLDIDVDTFRDWEAAARRMGFLKPNE